MIGSIIGDIVGSIYEFKNIKHKHFPLFSLESFYTDDTILTVATADCIMNSRSYETLYREYARKYPSASYGSSFRKWMESDTMGPYNSFGNGSAMRVGPVGTLKFTIPGVLAEAKCSASVTHNHPEGINGAKATALAIYLARKGCTKDAMKTYLEALFGYDLGRPLEKIRESYEFDETCQGTVPEAIIAFLESENFEDAIRNAISIGGDSDTLACITGGIAEAFYKQIPKAIINQAWSRIPEEFKEVIKEFSKRVDYYKPKVK